MLSWQVLLLASILLAAVIALLLLAREVQEQRRKDEQMRALLEQQRALFRVSTAVHSGRDWHDLLKAIVDAGMEAVQARAGALLFVDEKNRCLTFATAKTDNGYRVRKSTLAWGEGIAGRVAEERKVVILPEADDPLVFELPESLHPRTVVAVPLIGEQRTMGVLELISERRGNTFTEADREMLLTLGTQSATALENARLRENLAQHVHLLRRSIQELSALVDVSKALTALDVHQVLDKILTKALQMMQAEKGSLMLLDETEQVLRIEVARGLSEEIIRTARVKLGEGIAGRVALEGKPLRLLDQVNGERFRGHAVRHDVRDALCVPLWVQDKVIGVLNLNNKKGPEVFSEHDLELLTALANQAAISIHNARLFGDLQDLFLSTVRSLASAVDARDPYTAGHQERVTKYALVIADQLGMSPEEKETLKIAGLMHDVGKIGVPDRVLHKPGKLNDEEWQLMRQHAAFGAKIVEPIKRLHSILPGVRHHHERMDGRGYPDGLGGNDLPLDACILMVADAYDAMTSDRPYRQALGEEVALEELRRHSGSQFSPEIVQAFLAAHQAGRVHAGLQQAL